MSAWIPDSLEQVSIGQALAA